MDGRMERWTDGWMDGWMDGWLVEWSGGWMDAWMHGCMDPWLDGWLAGWMDGWMDGCRNKPTYRQIDVAYFSSICVLMSKERWISPLAVRFSQGKIHPFFHERGPISEAGSALETPRRSLLHTHTSTYAILPLVEIDVNSY